MSEDRLERAHPIHRHLGAGLSKAERRLIDGWWRRLPARDRRELEASLDPRADSCSFSRTPNPDGSSAWHGVAIKVQGRFVVGDGDRDDEAFPIDFYEYLVNHEISLSDGRTYHICTQHEAAEAVVRAGTIPAAFTCPLGKSSCPMRRVLALEPGRSLRLDVHVTATDRDSASPARG